MTDVYPGNVAPPLRRRAREGLNRVEETVDDGGFTVVALAVWVALGLVAIAAAVTYTRVPARQLYHVSSSGIDLGLRQSLAFAGYPAAPIAIAIAWLLAERFTRRGVLLAAGVATVLGSAVFWPGAVEEADPDSRPINVVALAAVLIVVVLTIGAARTGGVRCLESRPGDRVRVILSGLLLLAAIPWLAAVIGVSLDHVPALNSLFLSDSFVDQPGVLGLHPAVHAGLHHGLCGVVLVVGALWLSRGLSLAPSRGHRRIIGAYLSLLIAYGGANALQDFWLEQIVKRDLLTWQFPYMLQPKASLAFVFVLVAAAIVYAGLLRPGAILDRPGADGGRPPRAGTP
jgi:hypothetical protein